MNTVTTTAPAKVGRKPKAVKFPRGSFTIDEAVALNPTVCALTVRKNVSAGLASKRLVRLAENLETGKAGRPSFRFISAAAAAAAKANAAKSKARKASPAPTVVPTPTPVAAVA